MRYERDRIIVGDPPPGAATAAGRALLPSEIAEVHPDRTPPELWLHDGEILFVPAPERPWLALFARELRRTPLLPVEVPHA